MNLYDLPKDIVIHIIFNYLDIPDLFNIRLCSKRLNNFYNKWYQIHPKKYCKEYIDNYNHLSIIKKLPYYDKTIEDFDNELKTIYDNSSITSYIKSLYSKELSNKFIDTFIPVPLCFWSNFFC